MLRQSAVFPIEGRAGDDDEIALLKAGSKLIEIAETRCKTCQGMAVVTRIFLDLFEDILGDRLDSRESLPLLHLGQLKDRLLGMVEYDRRVFSSSNA
jgi:hypothetical protein